MKETRASDHPGGLGAALRPGRPLIAQAVLFGTFVNLLMLTGPLYMLQVYDRVLGARSEETLVALSLLVAFLYLLMWMLDHARARLMTRAGAALHDRLGARMFDAALAATGRAPSAQAPMALRDLDTLRSVMAAPVLLALFDLPWTPLFFAAIFLFHPLLGWAAVGGGLALVVLAALNQATTLRPRREAAGALDGAARLAAALQAEAATVRTLGLHAPGRARWQAAQLAARQAGAELADRHAFFSSATKAIRLLLQSAMLGLGAWLVLRDALSPGAMIATSVLMGRALAPVEMAVGQWSYLDGAFRAARRLSRLLRDTPPGPVQTALPVPAARLTADQLAVVPPGGREPTLRSVSFDLRPGQALGVIGPSGAGKTTLAHALTGLWAPLAGAVQLGGAPLALYPADSLGRHLGYLPQRVALFEGTVAENIARLDPEPDSAAVIAAATQAGAHEMILSLPQGYDTPLGPGGAGLSGGQIQRIGLARALYGNPPVLILDEPNAHLDNDGSIALNTAIRAAKAAGRAVLIMAHRPAAIRECDLLLMLEAGRVRAFGPPEEVLRSEVRNHAAVLRPATAGGVA